MDAGLLPMCDRQTPSQPCTLSYYYLFLIIISHNKHTHFLAYIPALLRFPGAMISGDIGGGNKRADVRQVENDGSEPWNPLPVDGKL